jgi:hypothetical protein
MASNPCPTDSNDVRCAVYIGTFDPDPLKVDLPPGSCCFKYGYSGSLESRIQTHKSGKEYSNFELRAVRKTDTAEEAQSLENGLHDVVDAEGCRVTHDGHRECFVATMDKAEEMLARAQLIPTHPTNPLECEYCGAVLRDAANLRRHQKTAKACIDAQKARGVSVKAESVSHTCAGCEKTFGRKDYFSKHIVACTSYLVKTIRDLRRENEEMKATKPSQEARGSDRLTSMLDQALRDLRDTRAKLDAANSEIHRLQREHLMLTR